MNITLRRPKEKDEADILSIAERYDFILPTKFREAAVVEKNEKIIAFGLIRTIIEAVLVVDGNPKLRVAALKNLIEQAKVDASNLEHDEIHVFVEDLNFADILVKHFNFREATGKALVLKLENPNGKR